jgi:hypothetical protein
MIPVRALLLSRLMRSSAVAAAALAIASLLEWGLIAESGAHAPL